MAYEFFLLPSAIPRMGYIWSVFILTSPACIALMRMSTSILVLASESMAALGGMVRDGWIDRLIVSCLIE